MDFLYKTFDQLRDLWKSMTPAARLASGLMAAVVVVSALWLVRGTPEKAEHGLFGGREFSQPEVAKMVQAFSAANLSGWEIVGNRIHVPEAMKHKYLAALAEANILPDSPYSDIEDAAKKDNPFTSVKAFSSHIATAKQKAIAKTLESMSGVEQAFVLYDESTTRTFSRAKNSSALVTIHTKTNEPLEEAMVRSIRTAVVKAYSGLKPTNVAIMDAKAGVTHDGPAEDGASPSLYLEQKERTDRFYEANIRKALQIYPGVRVAVNSMLTPETLQQMQSKRIEPKTVPISQKDVTEERQNTTSGPSGVPGAASNGVNQNSQPVAVNSKGDTSKETKTTSESLNVVGETVMLESKAPLMPDDVKASVSIPSNYFLDVWKARNPPVAGQPEKTPTLEDIRAIETGVTKNIESIVEKLLPPPKPGAESYPRIQVTTYQNLPEPAAAPTSWLDWLLPVLAANWQAAGMGVLALVGVVMLRIVMKSAQPGEAPAPIEEEIPEEKVNEPPPPGVISQLRERFSASGPSLREELQSLVQEDPQAAANVLQSWIGEAA